MINRNIPLFRMVEREKGEKKKSEEIMKMLVVA